MGKTTLVAWLFVMAGACLLVGGISLFERYQFWSDGQTGFMESSDKAIILAAKYKQYDALIIDVSYLTPHGRIDFPKKWVTANTVKRLSEGQKIPVRFLKSDPQRALLDGEVPDNPWWWLILGAILVSVALFAFRQYRRERS